MKHYVLTAIVPAAVLVLPSALSAEQPDVDNQITALGLQGDHRSWLSTDGPGQDGHYTMRIDIADLDPATATGWAEMQSRVRIGTGQLCNQAGALPLVGGRYNGAQRECWAETRSQALIQMQKVRDVAVDGRRVSMLDFEARSLAR